MSVDSLFSYGNGFETQGINGTGSMDSTALAELRRKKMEETYAFTSFSSQPDRATISEEAKAAWANAQATLSAQAVASAQTATSPLVTPPEQAETAGQIEADTPDEKTGAMGEFSDYMKSKRSKAQAASGEERIKQLEDKLKNLEGKLYQMTTGKESHEADGAEIESIQAQINTTVAELAEAKASEAAQ